MAAEPTLSTGDTGEWVTYLQQMLEYRQLGSGFDSGTYCASTEHAVRTLQRQHSLEETGQCDEATWAALATEQSTSDETAAGGITIAMSIEDSVEAPTDEVILTEVEQLPDNLAVS